MNNKIKEVLKRTDYALSGSMATEKDIRRICEEALTFDMKSVRVPSCYVRATEDQMSVFHVNQLKRSEICAVVGSENGTSDIKTKVYEAKQAIKNGATQIELILNNGTKEDINLTYIIEQIEKIRKAIDKKAQKTELLNRPWLTVSVEHIRCADGDITALCSAVAQAGADCIAWDTDLPSFVGTLRNAVNSVNLRYDTNMKLKINCSLTDEAASCETTGMNEINDLYDILYAGADRIGSDNIVKIALAGEHDYRINHSPGVKESYRNLEYRSVDEKFSVSRWNNVSDLIADAESVHCPYECVLNGTTKIGNRMIAIRCKYDDSVIAVVNVFPISVDYREKNLTFNIFPTSSLKCKREEVWDFVREWAGAKNIKISYLVHEKMGKWVKEMEH